MTLRGFSYPLSPDGKASLAPEPPWYYAGTLLAVEFWADPQAVAAVLPPRLTPDPTDPGGCTVFFADWQYCSEDGDELLDPVRSQYQEFTLLVNAMYQGAVASTCPYIYVDNVASLARGWIQGWPKKSGAVRTTRTVPVPGPSAPQVGEGGRFAGTLAVNDRRLADATVTLERVSTDPVYLGHRPVINMRYFPRLGAGERDKPAVHELVRSILSGATKTEIWEGSASLTMYPAPGEELHALAPVRVGRGFQYSTSFRVDDLETLAALV